MLSDNSNPIEVVALFFGVTVKKDSMRFVISIAAFLMMFGLAAFGIISAQKVSAASQTTASFSSAIAGLQTASIALRALRGYPVNPINELAQNSSANAPSLA